MGLLGLNIPIYLIPRYPTNMKESVHIHEAEEIENSKLEKMI